MNNEQQKQSDESIEEEVKEVKVNDIEIKDNVAQPVQSDDEHNPTFENNKDDTIVEVQQNDSNNIQDIISTTTITTDEKNPVLYYLRKLSLKTIPNCQLNEDKLWSTFFICLLYLYYFHILWNYLVLVFFD